MKLRFWLSALIVAATFQNAGSGQRPQQPAAPPLTSLAQAQMDINEDIEIMRRILAGRLSGRDQYVTTINSAPANWLRYTNSLASGQIANSGKAQNFGVYDVNLYPAAGSSFGQVEGVYLDGKGIVFTMSIPATPQDPLLSPTTKPTKTTSDWERARQVLHGENPEPAAKADAPQPTLADVILTVLAENGKNLRLKDDENVVVVVTFRSPAVAQGNSFSAYDSFVNKAVATAALDQSRLAALYATQNADPAGHGKSARDFLLLGDLHLRQQQYQQAQETLQKALTLEPNGDPKQMAETFRKLAETKLHLGQLDEAKAMIESAVTWEKKSKEAVVDKVKTDLSPSVTPRWPTKLIVTASKRQLDEVGAGKMTPDEFRKNIRIELVAPPTVK